MTSEGSQSVEERMKRPGISKDRTGSISGSFSLASPPPVDPEPAFIAASAASQIVTSDHQNQTEDWFEEPEGGSGAEPAVVSPTSLALVNAFLDQLLFNILACARSTSIASLRPAVSEVLKPRLAKDAISGADEELQEFLGAGDDEELSAFHNGLESRGLWDLALVWRRTRLRCMVYTRLGDMEEEDEETYVERERRDQAGEGHHRLSRDLGAVSPAAAIFLTSILEFVGEQALLVAGEAAHNRVEARRPKNAENNSIHASTQRVVVEDIDMEKIAFNTTLGRLWRSWKKRVRTPSMVGFRNTPRDPARSKGIQSPMSNPRSRSASISEVQEAHRLDAAKGPVDETAALASRSDLLPAASGKTLVEMDSQRPHSDDGLEETGNATERRPSSMIFYPKRSEGSPDERSRNTMQRRRSSSLPALKPAPYVVFSNEIFTTPREAPDSVNNSSGSVDKYSKPLPASPSPAQDDSTATAALHDGTTGAKNEARPLGSDYPSQQSQGLSKEEFDRQMLQLVKEMQPQPTPHSIDSQRQSSVDSNAESNSNNGPVKPSAKHDQLVEDDRELRSELPASHGVDPKTIAYWRGAGGPSVSSLPSQERNYTLDEPKLSAAQGEGPRTTSGGDSDYGRMWEHQVPYFYRETSSSHSNYRDATLQRPIESQNESPSTSAAIHEVDRPQTDNGPPPLTPLRELMEAAHDTSDETSSIAPSHDAPRSEYTSSDRYQNGVIPRSEPVSNQPVSQARPPSKQSDLRSKLPAVNTGTDRAAVQRVVPSPISAHEPLTPVGRTSTSSNRALKNVQTSSSSASGVSQKLKGLVGRESSDSRRPGTSRHSSEGDGSVTGDRRSLKTPKGDGAMKNFDQLIKSDETIQYTLTPQNMRDMESPDSPRWNHKRTETAEMADFIRKTGPEEKEQARPVSGRSLLSGKGLNGLRANPTASAKAPEQQYKRQPQPEPIASTAQTRTSSRPSTAHAHSGIPRDARTKDDSTREFADFLRSTGPAPGVMSPQKPGPPIAEPRPIKALPATSPRPTSGQGKRITKPNPNAASQEKLNQQKAVHPATNHQQNSRRTDPAQTKKPIPKLQARDATTSSDSTMELAEFLRNGPTDRSEGRMRLPRAGEQQRPITDNNGIQKINNGKAKEVDVTPRLSVASTQLSSVPSKSVHSVNSRTGLLDSSTTRTDGRDSTDKRPLRNDDPPQPIRKQRRVKDPYVIDTDSENEDDYRAPPQRQEESLIDFLNSVTPPPSPPRNQSAFTNGNSSKTSPPQKSHYPSMHDRLTRDASKTPKQTPLGVPSVTKAPPQQPPSNNQSKTQTRGRPEAPRPPSSSAINSKAPQIPPFNPRETSPHLISQVGTKLDTYRITQPTYAAHVDRERNGPRQQLKAREEREPGAAMTDLADFFRNSEPPPEPVKRPVTPVKEKEKENEGGLKGWGWRRKKSTH